MANIARRRAQPGRIFIVTIFLISCLALLSFLRKAPTANRNLSRGLQRRDNGQPAMNETCHHVHHYRPEDQCDFIRSNCPDEDSGLISYLELYYCRLPEAKPVAFLVIALWAALLFTTIGVAASDFFCINLSTISALLGLSESMAGVTFLAFGNGSPDVFSTFAAIRSHSGSLAVGELIGAAGFITAVVAGSMALIRPFHVYKKSFVRDVGFFIVAVAFSMFFMANGALNLWECAVMVGFYVFYVAVVVVMHWHSNRKRRRREREATMRGDYLTAEPEVLETEEEYQDDIDRSSRKSSSRPVTAVDFDTLERSSLIGHEDFDDLDDEDTRDKWMGEITSNMRVTRPPGSERPINFTPIRPSLIGALEFRAVLASLNNSRSIRAPLINMRRYSDAPYYTTAHQQQTQARTSDPAGAQDAFEVSVQEAIDHHRPSADLRHSLGGRERAVSAGDATFTRISNDRLRGVPSNNNLIDSFPDAETPLLERYGDMNISTSPLEVEPPLVSITSAPDEVGGDTAATRNRASSADLLAPPDRGPHRRVQSADSTYQTPNGSSYGTTKPIPRSHPSPPRLSPMHSPIIASLSNKNSFPVPDLDLGETHPGTPPSSEDINNVLPHWWPHSFLPPPSDIAKTLLPTVYEWKEKKVWERILGIATAPSFFLLTITLPVVEPEKADQDPPVQKITHTNSVAGEIEAGARAPSHPHHVRRSSTMRSIDSNSRYSTLEQSVGGAANNTSTSATGGGQQEWNRWLVAVQCFTAPYFIVLIIWANFSLEAKGLVRPTLYSILISLACLFVLLSTTTTARPPKWHFLLCFVGFAVSIAWISTIADEVVSVLKTIGVIFNISDAILGLTIFAVGNSLGDLVADVTVARLGYPVMALSACFGGPMLNILLGIGLSGLYMTIDKAESRHHKHPDRPVKFRPYHIRVSATLLISAVALMVTLIGLLIVVPLNRWKMDKRIGWGLIILWVITTVGNVVVEVTGLGDDLMEPMVKLLRAVH